MDNQDDGEHGYVVEFPVGLNEKGSFIHEDGNENIELLFGSNELYRTLQSLADPCERTVIEYSDRSLTVL